MAIEGGPTADALTGTQRGNTIAGFGGDDAISGRAGTDRVSGGGGGDRIAGGEGADRLSGGGGDDVIFGFGDADRNPASAHITVTAAGPFSFAAPVYATAAPGDPNRLYVVEQHSGRIRILDPRTGEVRDEPFLDIPDEDLAPGASQGLMSVAFHPDYAANGRFFVHLTGADGDVVVRAYRRSAGNPDRAEPASGDTILRIDRDINDDNHNGGWLGFGPDGLLFVSVGDEGRSGDPTNNGQNLESLWGKLLRIDVDGDDFAGSTRRDYAIPGDNPFVGRAGADEIWALGLRNPWRASFDRRTGDLYVGDVGQAEREEINVEPAGFAGGANYGWKVREGRLVFDDTVPGNPPADSDVFTDPVVDYRHDARGGFAVTGGYVYRGDDPGMRGRYLYADVLSDRIWSFRLVGGKAVDVTDHTEQLVVRGGGSFARIVSFAEDGNGELYAVGLGGEVSGLRFGAASGDGADRIDGGGGDDRLFGGAGRDVIEGGTGRDRLEGGAQDDRLDGGGGDDRIAGGPGRDRITGGAGTDVVTGGGDADTFVFAPSSEADTIRDFEDDRDRIRLDGFGFGTVAEALELAREAGGDVVFDFGGGRVLTVLGARIDGLGDDLVV